MSIDNYWTLFLDRDGVINRQIEGAYIRKWTEWEWAEGSLEAIVKMTGHFQRIVVATNQQGVGKGLMKQEELDDVHRRMLEEIKTAGGHIDKVYACTKLATENPQCRKPNPGMAIQAQKDFPNISYEHSIMVGDSITDMQFGSVLGMVNVFIESNLKQTFELGRRIAEGKAEEQVPVDYRFPNLLSFANFILEK